MKKFFTTVSLLSAVLSVSGQGWPANYDGVMLQGFYWDSFSVTKWTKLEKQADEIASYFSLVWVPQSGNTGSSTSMGYDPLYYFDQNSSFGNEEQLRNMIQAYKERGTGIVADVVVNHRKNLSNWVDFPAETYQGVTYQMQSTDIVANDDNGATKNWAIQNGYSLSANNDEGEGWDGMRDLDHKSENVQQCVKAYVKYLTDDLGYTGFRYDMVKGFAGSRVAAYNQHAGVQFSVGENWDGNTSAVKTWIDKTRIDDVPQSAAFDFPFRYTCRDAVNNGDWSKLKNSSVMAETDYCQYSVTFVENHDTEYRSASYPQDPIRKDTLALNAWMMAMPGTPCVFLKHWMDCKEEIKNMIEVRKLVGITNQSEYAEWMSSKDYCGRTVTGSKGTLRVLCGNYPYAVASSFAEVISGKNYKYYVLRSIEAPWIGLGSGIYPEGTTLQVPLSAISEDETAQLVYTLDGSDPTANSAKVNSGSTISISQGCTLKVGLLKGGVVSNIQSRTYFFESEETTETYQATMHVRNESGTMNPLYIYVWAGPDNEQINGGWPGAKATETAEVGGLTWYVQTFNIPTTGDYVVNFVFANQAGNTQTVDVTGMTQDAYYVIKSSKTGSKYNVEDVTDQYAGISEVLIDVPTGQSIVYDLQGRQVEHLQQGCLYVSDGKKFIMK